MKLLIFNYVTKECIATLDTPRLNDLFRNLDEVLSDLQSTNDVLKIGKLCRISSSGTKQYHMRGCVMDSIAKDGLISYDNDGSCCYGIIDKTDVKEPKNLKIYTEDFKEEEIDLKLGFIAYKEGFIINTGKKISNIFGATSFAYLKSIGTKNVHGSFKKDARIFNKKAAILHYLEKNIETLKFLVDKYGYCFSIEFSCKEFEQTYDETKLSSKNKEKMDVINEKIENLLEEINSYEEEEKEEEPLPVEITDEVLKDEALKRMKEFNMYAPTIERFKKDGDIKERLFMSESGGILYNLDDKAKEAANKAIEDGLLPYHIIHTITNFGDLYNVLYVSKDTANWQFERADKNGDLDIYCYNETEDFVEYGSSRIISTNGGLQRIE